MTLNEKLNSIRKIIDMEIVDDIESVMGKANAISGVIGLSAECKAQAKKQLELARMKAFIELEGRQISPSVQLKMIDAHCSDELAAYEYADRLNAGITHQLDLLRTTISYRKEEMANERINNFTI